MSRISIQTLILAAFIGNAAVNGDEKQPVWSVSPSAAAHLADEVDGDWFLIRPPKEYARVDLGDTSAYDRAGIKIAAWTLTTERIINPTITVMSLPAPEQPVDDKRELFDGIMDSLTAKWPNAHRSKVSTGRWNGTLAYRCQFSADDANDKIQGIVLAEFGRSSNFVVSVIHPANTVADRAALKTLAFAAVSCKRK